MPRRRVVDHVPLAADSRLPAADFAAPHACVNWDALADWQAERTVDIMRPGWLRHPSLGEFLFVCLGRARQSAAVIFLHSAFVTPLSLRTDFTDWETSGAAYPDGQGTEIGVVSDHGDEQKKEE